MRKEQSGLRETCILGQHGETGLLSRGNDYLFHSRRVTPALLLAVLRKCAVPSNSKVLALSSAPEQSTISQLAKACHYGSRLQYCRLQQLGLSSAVVARRSGATTLCSAAFAPPNTRTQFKKSEFGSLLHLIPSLLQQEKLPLLL